MVSSLKYLRKKFLGITSTLHKLFFKRCKNAVKVHGVFPSRHQMFASAQTIQIHWANTGDREAVVTPFMRVRTYLTRNFATLGPSWLRPPFTGI